MSAGCCSVSRRPACMWSDRSGKTNQSDSTFNSSKSNRSLRHRYQNQIIQIQINKINATYVSTKCQCNHVNAKSNTSVPNQIERHQINQLNVNIYQHEALLLPSNQNRTHRIRFKQIDDKPSNWMMMGTHKTKGAYGGI